MPTSEQCLSQLESLNEYWKLKRPVSRERCWGTPPSVATLQTYLFLLTSLRFIISRHFSNGIHRLFVCFSIKLIGWLLDTSLRHIHNLWLGFKALVFIFVVQESSQDCCLKRLPPNKSLYLSHRYGLQDLHILNQHTSGIFWRRGQHGSANLTFASSLKIVRFHLCFRICTQECSIGLLLKWENHKSWFY